MILMGGPNVKNLKLLGPWGCSCYQAAARTTEEILLPQQKLENLYQNCTNQIQHQILLLFPGKN